MGITRTLRTRPRAQLVAAAAATLLLGLALFQKAQAVTTKPPQTLQETGLYADFAKLEIDQRHLAFSPQYPLWTDGAGKRRWISLPPGTAIDASDPDAWIFPVGTRFWKEFSFGGQRIETRYLERQADGQWLYAAYVWSEDGQRAELVPANGKRGAYPLGRGRSHAIPSVSDCKACHEGGPSVVLGFSALQLSPERDSGALHADASLGAEANLASLIEKGLVIGLPSSVAKTPPSITARSETERAALGYLHGNCGHCHNEKGPLKNLGLFLRHVANAEIEPGIASTVGHGVRKPAPGQSADAVLRIEPQHPERSALIQRVRSRYSALQMPPLGTELVDREAVDLLQRWIAEMKQRPEEEAGKEKGK